jgi:hypothetical protein
VTVTIRPAVAADLAAVATEPLPYAIRAITLEIDGKVMAVGGLAFPPGDVAWAFVDQVPELARYPVTIHRAGIAGMELIRGSGLSEVVATADSANPKALRWLKPRPPISTRLPPPTTRASWISPVARWPRRAPSIAPPAP